MHPGGFVIVPELEYVREEYGKGVRSFDEQLETVQMTAAMRCSSTASSTAVVTPLEPLSVPFWGQTT